MEQHNLCLLDCHRSLIQSAITHLITNTQIFPLAVTAVSDVTAITASSTIDFVQMGELASMAVSSRFADPTTLSTVQSITLSTNSHSIGLADLFNIQISNRDGSLPVVLDICGHKYIIPEHSWFVMSDFSFLPTLCKCLLDQPLRFSLVLMDPPWENKSVKYASMDCYRLSNIPLGQLVLPNGIVAVWVTNKSKVREMQPLKHSIDTNLVENPSACMPCVPEVQTEPTDAFKLDSSITAGAKSSSPKLQDSSIENQSIEPEQLPAVQPELALPTHSPWILKQKQYYLQSDIIIHSDLTTIRNERLLELLGDYLLRRSARDSSTSRTSEQLTFEHTMDDILVAIPMLQFGLDVNVHSILFWGLN
ncbi:hypothetical protein BSLG_006038 [Batrachochytrium salamandrivorans]|nr:hypothetical protein BSLG_006038 [Batrachochytrium salamandrivorans]